MGINRPSQSLHDVGDDPFGGRTRPATVIDARRLRTLGPLARAAIVRPVQIFDYATALATIVAVTRFRTRSARIVAPVPN
jgi:hypothetical protein